MKRILEFLRAAVIFQIPAGQQNVDDTGANGLIGLMANVNNYSETLSSVATSGTTITLIASSANAAPSSGNAIAGFLQLNAGATGALTVNLPSTNSILAALGPSVPQDGTYQEPIHVMNNSGQTATITAGDANQSLLGSMAVAVGSVRKFMLRVLNSSNISVTNVGTWTF
jgi:hypothetical protein